MGIAWTLVGIIVPILIGLGATMLGLNPPDFRAARFCFWLSASLLGGMTAVWVSQRPNLWRAAAGVATVISISVGLPLSLRWVKKREDAICHTPAPTPDAPLPNPLKIEISAVPHKESDAPHLGMRIAYLSDPLLRGSGSWQEVEFRLRLLSGRPATSVQIQSVYSKTGIFSIRFSSIPFLTADQEQVVGFEVWSNETRPTRKQLAFSDGEGTRLAEFVWDSRAEGGIETSPIVVNFFDREDYMTQRFRLDFDPNTYRLSVMDDPQMYNTSESRKAEPIRVDTGYHHQRNGGPE